MMIKGFVVVVVVVTGDGEFLTFSPHKAVSFPYVGNTCYNLVARLDKARRHFCLQKSLTKQNKSKANLTNKWQTVD